MQSQQITDKLEITGLANKLFMYTDNRQWQKLLDEVFAEQVMFDMSSAGGAPPQNMAARDICEMWRQGFEPLDGVHHQAGHYLINITKDEAEIFGYAVAIHYKKMAKKGNTRTFVGSYDLKAVRLSQGWRLTGFKYNLKWLDGNTTLE